MGRAGSRAPGAVLLALGAALLLGGCKTSSQWQFVRRGPSRKIVTKVLVRTEPTGAEISVNGNFVGRAPVEIPIRYAKSTKVYERRNYAPYPHVEERELPEYSGNTFTIGAYVVGYHKAEEQLELTGEESMDVSLVLRAKPE